MQLSSWSKHVFERDDSHAISRAISRQERGGLHKCIARFITYSCPGRADTWFPSLPRKECTGVRYVITKFSLMDGLPNFLTHGAPLARFARRSSAIMQKSIPRSANWTVCAFVSLTRDNIIEQYINTFLETPRPNVIQTASYCCFEKFRIKPYPNRSSLDYLIDLKKSTNQWLFIRVGKRGNLSLKWLQANRLTRKSFPIFHWG